MFSFDLHENERLITRLRQSESLLFKPAVIVLVLLYVPLWFFIKYDLLGQFGWFLAVWVVAVLLYAANKYMLWLVTAYLITTKRVVAITYTNLLKKQTQEMMVSDIANIRVAHSGLFSTMLSFASVEIQSSAHDPLVFKNISKAGTIKDLLWHTKEKQHLYKPV